mmetsp:Transcript_16705/g.45649  ORF Transcript_16705/g.45649 Transcript_16705/m.45649 type:complete len:207 (-) Transcript_16705:88-708(-)
MGVTNDTQGDRLEIRPGLLMRGIAIVQRIQHPSFGLACVELKVCVNAAGGMTARPPPNTVFAIRSTIFQSAVARPLATKLALEVSECLSLRDALGDLNHDINVVLRFHSVPPERECPDIAPITHQSNDGALCRIVEGGLPSPDCALDSADSLHHIPIPIVVVLPNRPGVWNAVGILASNLASLSSQGGPRAEANAAWIHERAAAHE